VHIWLRLTEVSTPQYAEEDSVLSSSLRNQLADYGQTPDQQDSGFLDLLCLL